VNWTNAPAYKTAKHFTTALNKVISLPYALNIMNSVQLINDLKETKVHPHIRLASFDIPNMYPDIPTLEVQHIIADILNHNISDPLEKQEYLQLYESIINQNYFTTTVNFTNRKRA
jgi:hypothetical protein